MTRALETRTKARLSFLSFFFILDMAKVLKLLRADDENDYDANVVTTRCDEASSEKKGAGAKDLLISKYLPKFFSVAMATMLSPRVFRAIN